MHPKREPECVIVWMSTCSRSVRYQNRSRVQFWLSKSCYSRLRLCGVVAQRNSLALDLIEALFTIVVPVSNKPKFWWTTPFPTAQSITDSAREGSHPSGQDRVPQAEQAGSGSAGQQEVVITTASHDFFEGWGGEGWGLEVHGVQAKASQCWDHIEREDRRATHGRQDETNIQDNTQQRAEAKHRLAIWTWEDEQQQPLSQLEEREQNQRELNMRRELEQHRT